MPVLTEIPDQAYYFPIGIAYVSSSLKKSGRNVTTLNLNYKQDSIYNILDKVIRDSNIDVILSGGLTVHYWQLVEIFKAAKKIRSEIITGVGGNNL